MKTEIAFFAAGYISATFITLFIVFQYLRYKEQPDEVVEELKFEVGLIYKFPNGDYFCCEKLEYSIDSLICASGFGFRNGDFITTRYIGCNENSFKDLEIVSTREWTDYIDNLWRNTSN